MKKKKKVTFLIRFAKNILKALRIRNVRLYGSKFSKKVYTLHQHIVLLSLREFHKGIGYRLLCDILPDYSLLLEFLGLARIPHFTTLHKVSQRLRGSTVESIFLGFARRARFRAGIDSTGLSLQHSTYYYEQRLEHFRKAKNRKPGRPTSLFADLDGQIILSAKLLRGKKSDSKMMIPTIQKAEGLFGRIISNDADKGYDAEYNHCFVNECMGTKDFIKMRNEPVPVHRTKGEYRKKAKNSSRKATGRPRKNHRNRMESIIFALKKICGEHLSATSSKGQRQQSRFRIIAYNAYRKIKAFLVRISTEPEVLRLYYIFFTASLLTLNA
ncbi:transposase [Candidatus Woesearchaeota archaeon]|nr:transposase [Candidatus Woesearchaeota archaeon]